MWKEKYISMIGCCDVEQLKIIAAQQIKDKNLPNFLYKYRSISGFSLHNLETDTVWLSPPREYNDPFEFVEYIDVKKLQNATASTELDEILKEFKEKSVPENIIFEAKRSGDPLNVIFRYHFRQMGFTDLEIEDMFDKVDLVMKTHLLEANHSKIKRMQEAMKVCSFCEEHTQLLMWSHYANNHKGFCVQYDISQWESNDLRRRLLYPVIYQKDFYDVTDHLISQITKNTFNNLYPIISGATKSTEWAYEKEWRFIFQIGESFKPQNYQMDCQKAVYLGYRISKEDRDRVIEICRKAKLLVYQAKVSKEKYELEFELIHL